MTHYDLVIVGGGLVGAGLAAALRQTHFNIALIDARLPSSNDPRLFALNASSCQFLKNIGVWPQLVEHATAIHQVHVSQQRHFGVVRLDRADVPTDALGHVIPAHFIEQALNDLLLSQTNVTLYRPAQLTGLEQKDEVVSLDVQSDVSVSSAHASVTPRNDDEEALRNDGGAQPNDKVSIHITTNLLIGADGAESSVRQLANITAQHVDYEQSAIVTRTQLQRSHQHIAYERFTTDGAIAMLPLADNECATIWTADNATIAKLMHLSDAEFLQRLQKEFGYRLGRLQSIKKRHMFPLRMVRADKALAEQVLLLGNAAHTLHPIAAQGFNLALYEVAAVADALIKQSSLADAIARVQKQQAASINVSHYIPQLFGSNSRCLGVLAQLGMIGFDLAPPLKKKFMTSMMGRAGNVPPLLLGVNE